MSNNRPAYIIVSPGRNEAEFMRRTLDSVCNQSFLPYRWVIVNDGSTDNSAEILDVYSSQYPWIKVVTRDDRGHRSVGPGVVDAFYSGLALSGFEDCRYMCKLDLDLELPSRYFEELIRRCEQDPRIGSCSGKAYMLTQDGKLLSENVSDEMSVGASKFMRTECFKDIGGFVREVMWDGIDCHFARMNGWKAVSWDSVDLNFIHLRPMGSSDKGILRGRYRHGYGQYYMGGSLVYSFAAAVYRLNHPPFVLGSIVTFFAHLYHASIRSPRLNNVKLRKFIRRYQWNVLTIGKKQAVRKFEKSGEDIWQSKYRIDPH